MKLKKRRKKERISKEAIRHSSLGDVRFVKETGKLRMFGGGHGQENIDELKKHGIKYKIDKIYPNGVRIGVVPQHKKSPKRKDSNQSWFPSTWTRKTIKRAGEETINAIPYKLPDGMTTFGKYKNVKVGVKRTNGKVATVFAHKYQSEGKRKKRSASKF